MRLGNDRHDLRVLYSLFTHCLHTFGPRRLSVEKLNMWSRCNYSVCVCVRCARWSRRDVRALRTESILFFPQISRNIVSFFVRSSFEHV